MNREDIIRMAREAGCIPRRHPEYDNDIQVFATPDVLERFAALVAAAERERICKAIKEEDDYCVTEGDYMLDSDDCIAVAKSEWVRPDYSAGAIRARGEG
jgi:hypothetical protein